MIRFLSLSLTTEAKKKKKRKSIVSADEEAGESGGVLAGNVAIGSTGGNSHPSNMMSMNAIGPSMAAPQHGADLSGLRSVDSAGSGALTDSALTDSDHRKSRQDEETSNPRKEKSVLQAKLTKLAIQIGYGGKVTITFFSHSDFKSIYYHSI